MLKCTLNKRVNIFCSKLCGARGHGKVSGVQFGRSDIYNICVKRIRLQTIRASIKKSSNSGSDRTLWFLIG